MRIKIIFFLLIFFLLFFSTTVSLIAHECIPACTGCQTCEAGACVDDDKCGGSVCCDGTCCSAGQTCCNGTCCDNCCDGITCYDPATETCCNDGYGTVCSGSFPCCCDVPGGKSICTNYCYDSVCCSSGQSCCDNGCCDYPCCGNEGCCGATEYCCGNPSWNELCCNNDEVCCWYVDGSGDFVFYCNPPCWDEIIDTTTCDESHEEDHECPGCLVFPGGGGCLGHIYRDYSGLDIEECHDGCPQVDWNVSHEICYEIKACVDADVQEDALCMEFGNGELGCVVPDDTVIVACIVCGTGGSVVDTCIQETCRCQ